MITTPTKQTVLLGNCADVLKTIPAASVDCCVTSPPYYSLRDYKTEPLIWDASEGCEHEWGEKIQRQYNAQTCYTTGRCAGEPWGPGKKAVELKMDISQCAFCSKCGAWRGQLGLEPTPQLYIKHLVGVFDEVKRVLKPSGTCWVNIGDSFGDKSLEHIPSRFAIAMTDNGWILRNEIIWHKPNCMPSSVKDRFTVDFEKLFFFVKSKRYYFEPQYEPLNELTIERGKYNWCKSKTKASGYQTENGLNRDEMFPVNPNGRNKRAVWTIPTKPYSGAHFAVFPPELIETPIKAGCPTNGTVLDPFGGSGTTAKVARSLGRSSIIIELNPAYLELATERAMTNVPDVLSFEARGAGP